METAEKNVFLLYKKLGETPRECLDRFKKEYLVKQVVSDSRSGYVSMTYAGRLDPMAEGALLVLASEKISEKQKYIDLPKEYEFEILWECSTDTGDILGVSAADLDGVYPGETDVRHYVESHIGRFSQKYPAYSSQTVDGKALIEWSREGRIGEIEIPSHDVEVSSAQYVSRKLMSGSELLSEISRRIRLVGGDFRQEVILSSWKKNLGDVADRHFVLDTVRMEVSSGFYVRQYVMDMAESLGTAATTFHILRTKVGEYSALSIS